MGRAIRRRLPTLIQNTAPEVPCRWSTLDVRLHIVGVHEHVTRYAPDKSELQIQGESIIKALDDAGP